MVFDLVDRTLTEKEADFEAARCLQCSTLCDKCVEVCPNRANLAYSIGPMTLELPLIVRRDGRPTTEGTERFEILQSRQIVHLDDLCNECGNCATFCVHPGKPYLDKPRLFLDRGSFLAESGDALIIERGADSAAWIVSRKSGGAVSTLRLHLGPGASRPTLDFESGELSGLFAVEAGVVRARSLEARRPFEGPLSLREMARCS